MSERTKRRISRTWATPLVGGLFMLIAGTGVAMFFHVGGQQGHVLHEWLGFGLVAAVALHAFANGNMFKAHASRRGVQAMGVVFALVLAGALAPMDGGGANPQGASRAAVEHLADAPLTAIAPIAGRDAETLSAELRSAGFPDAAPERTCRELAGSDRHRLMEAIATVFPSAPR